MPASIGRVRERLALRGSEIHGKGVFAREAVPAGDRLVEYVGERITAAEGDERYPYYDDEPYHTFLFQVEDDVLIDGGVRGNISRWINHSCEPNCEFVIEEGRVYVDSLRPLEPGEELTCDYHLMVAGRYTEAVKRRYPCHCGAPTCRGTMLGPKRKTSRKKTAKG